MWFALFAKFLPLGCTAPRTSRTVCFVVWLCFDSIFDRSATRGSRFFQWPDCLRSWGIKGHVFLWYSGSGLTCLCLAFGWKQMDERVFWFNGKIKCCKGMSKICFAVKITAEVLKYFLELLKGLMCYWIMYKICELAERDSDYDEYNFYEYFHS